MLDPFLSDIVRLHLEPGERPVWIGRPRPAVMAWDRMPSALGGIAVLAGMVAAPLNWMFLMPVRLTDGGTSPFMRIGTLYDAAVPVMVLVLLAALLVLLQPFIACDRAYRTVYAVTDRRLLQVRDGVFGQKLRAARFGSFAPPVLDLRSNGTGTITFTPRPSAGRTGDGIPVLTRFSAVHGAAEVHRLILDRMGPDQGGRTGAPDIRDYLDLLIQGKRTIDDA